ncbi:MAG: hypothetical protein C0490_22140, partial [Marivirga sp.]|nr:hypothetical protein [Marivirga sp.]
MRFSNAIVLVLCISWLSCDDDSATKTGSVTSISPDQGFPWSEVTLQGNFPEFNSLDVWKVTFNSVEAQVLQKTSSSIKVLVPEGFNDQEITVSVSLNSINLENTAKFTYLPLPEILLAENRSIIPDRSSSFVIKNFRTEFQNKIFVGGEGANVVSVNEDDID